MSTPKTPEERRKDLIEKMKSVYVSDGNILYPLQPLSEADAAKALADLELFEKTRLTEIRSHLANGDYYLPEWQADVSFVLAHLDAAKAEVERLRNDTPAMCAYCTFEAPIGSKMDVLQKHVLTCEFHPLVKLLDAERERSRILREALDIVASWAEGSEVTSSFDCPGDAELAREALAAAEKVGANE